MSRFPGLSVLVMLAISVPTIVFAQVIQRVPQPLSKPELAESPDDPSSKIVVGQKAPPFAASDLAGNPVELMAGAKDTKLVVLDFWSSTEPQSLNNATQVGSLARAFANQGVRFIAICLDENEDKANAMARRYGPSVEQVFDGAGFRGDIAQAYGVKNLPFTVLLDNDLKVIVKDVDYNALAPQLMTTLNRQVRIPAIMIRPAVPGVRLQLAVPAGRLQAAIPLRDASLPDKLGVKKIVNDGWKGSWSPDGSQLVFGSADRSDLLLITLADGSKKSLGTAGKDACWSSDGRWIAFLKEPNQDNYQGEVIHVVRPDGESLRDLARGGYPSWSADGKKIFYHSRVDNHVYSIEVDDEQAKPVRFFEEAGSWYPAVSPDEKLIAFGADQQLLIMDVVTRKVVLAWPVPGTRGVLPAWSPDGRYVGYGGFDTDLVGLWVLDVQNRTAKQVAKGAYTMPAWSADGSQLSFDYRGGETREIWTISREGLEALPNVAADEIKR